MGRPETSRPVAKFSTTGPFVVQCAIRCGERRYLRSAAPAARRDIDRELVVASRVRTPFGNALQRNLEMREPRLGCSKRTLGDSVGQRLELLRIRPSQFSELAHDAVERDPNALCADACDAFRHATTSFAKQVSGHHIYNVEPERSGQKSGPVEDPDRQARAKNCHQDSHDQGNERPYEHLAQAWIRWCHRESRNSGVERHQLSPEALTKRPIRPQPPKVSVRRIARSFSPATSGRYKRA